VLYHLVEQMVSIAQGIEIGRFLSFGILCQTFLHITWLEVFKRFKDGIYQAFMTGYSNGAIEGTNNFIKVIKRVAYGYRNFENMKLRIKIIKGCFFTPVNRKSL